MHRGVNSGTLNVGVTVLEYTFLPLELSLIIYMLGGIPVYQIQPQPQPPLNPQLGTWG